MNCINLSGLSQTSWLLSLKLIPGASTILYFIFPMGIIIQSPFYIQLTSPCFLSFDTTHFKKPALLCDWFLSFHSNTINKLPIAGAAFNQNVNSHVILIYFIFYELAHFP